MASGRPLLGALALLVGAPVLAQPADLPIPPATTGDYPPGVTVREVSGGKVYADRRGLTLYGLDMRTVLRWAPDPALYCGEACQAEWEPLRAPANAVVNIRFPGASGRSPDDFGGGRYLDNRRAPDWTVIAGPAGPQWVYKGWHMAFVRRGSQPGSTAFDGHDGMIWNTLKFVPPVPQVIAPAGIRSVFIEGRHVLSDSAGRALFTGRCAQPCAWTPLAAPLASRGMGQWKVGRSADTAQWHFGALPVFVQTGAALPEGARHIEP